MTPEYAPDTPVTFRLKNVPAEMILRLIFKEIGLTYYLDNGVVIVTTPEAADSRLETRVYRVDDLIESPTVSINTSKSEFFAGKMAIQN